jgi:hypothetical protein
MILSRVDILWLAARVLAVIGILACAPHRAPQEIGTPVTGAPATCAADRGGPGWIEQRVADTPVAFCVPPDIRYVEGLRKFGPSGPQPYPRARNMPDWMEEWHGMPGGRWALVATHYATPYAPPSLPAGAEDVRQSIVAGAGSAVGPAILREYRVARDAVRRRVPPGEEEFSSFSVSPHKADLVVPLGPGRWLVLEANLENPAQRTELVRVLRSARRLDR